MSGNEDSDSVLGEARRHHLKQVNGVLRRPGMYGRDEAAEWLLLEAMAAVDGSLAGWFTERDGLRERAAFTSTGVVGAYRSILPASCLRDATASVYAEIAHRLGWLEVDRALSAQELQRMRAEIGGWVAQDRTLSQVVEAFGPPSVQIGGTNPFYPKTFAYTTADRDDDLICLHLWNALAGRPSGIGVRGVHPEPVVLAARHRPARLRTPSRSHRKVCAAGPAPTTSTRPGKRCGSSTVSTPDTPAQCSTRSTTDWPGRPSTR